MSCKHKFRTNLDGLTMSQTSVAGGIHQKAVLSPYVTIIFCEKCGFVVHDASYSKNNNTIDSGGTPKAKT